MLLMLQFAKKLAECDQDYFNGWIIAGLEIEIKGTAVSYTLETVSQKAGLSVINICGNDADGDVVKTLKVILLKPKNISVQSAAEVQTDATKMIALHKFTEQELAEYLAVSGDMNQLHQGAKPIVPGLMMVNWLLEHLQMASVCCKVKFIRPVICNEEIRFYRDTDKINACVGTKLAFSLILK